MEEMDKVDNMILIAHRGNISGPNPDFENSIPYIQEALNQGYNVEVDVWFDDDKGWFLGHDYPQYTVDFQFLADSRFWIHCKNDKALYQMSKHKVTNLNYFWHQTDDFTLTSRNNVWCYPGKDVPYTDKIRAIVVMPEIHNQNVEGYGGICSDYIEKYKI